MRRVKNPPQRFDRLALEWEVEPPEVKLEVYEDTTHQILAHNDSPDLGFDWSLNPYRGCTHACPYCYARPSHEYLGFGAGTDFDSRIVVKPSAPELLRSRLLQPSWRGELIAFSGDTDCYQPLEAHYRLTRRCLEVCLELENPVDIVTKGFLVTRDVDLLGEMARQGLVHVTLSIPFLDESVARILEPGAPRPAKRFEAMKTLSAAGVPTELLVAPLVPGLSDVDVPGLLQRARDAGARSAGYSMLRLPGPVAEIFIGTIKQRLPLKAARIEALVREIRGGELDDKRFHHRMRGSGRYWEAVVASFRLTARRLGLAIDRHREETPRRRPPRRGQLSLFEQE